MGQIDRKQIIILYVTTNEIQLMDIPRALDELGYSVYKASLGIQAQGFEKEACNRLMDAIDNMVIQCAISYDFSETIAQACFETGIPYISWVYDAPQAELYTHYAQYPSNYVFVFDRMQQKRLQEIGVPHVYHMPLAIHAEKVQLALKNDTLLEDNYTGDVAFVGQLYRNEHLERLVEEAPIDVKQKMEENIQSCFLKWNDNTKLHGSMKEPCVAYFSEIDQKKVIRQYPYMTEQFFYEAAVLSRLLANRERVCILNALSERYDVRCYTFDKDISRLCDKVKVMPGAKYDYEVSHVYRHSKINLNITLHCIETGASQRIFDVMAAGGFMLSNYQKELAEMFVPGQEIVLYHNMKELEQYVEYYLSHDEERKQIARNGQQKVLRLHNFHNTMQQVMEIVIEKEKPREQSYVELQRKWLLKRCNECLEKKTEKVYRELYQIVTDAKYETVIQKTTELGLLREMMECWKMENETGTSSLLEDIDNLEQLEYKYLKVKHGMWRIEQGICEEKCMEAVEMMQREKISKLFLAWVIYANLADREEVVVRVADYMSRSNPYDAVQLLSYGLILFPGNTTLIMKKAGLLMDLSMWTDALSTLYLLKEPDENIRILIEELESVLQKMNHQTVGEEYE